MNDAARDAEAVERAFRLAEFRDFLRFERGLSERTVDAYVRDVSFAAASIARASSRCGAMRAWQNTCLSASSAAMDISAWVYGQVPMKTASMSSGAIPASSIASPATSAISDSTSGSSSLPKRLCAQPTMHGFMLFRPLAVGHQIAASGRRHHKTRRMAGKRIPCALKVWTWCLGVR